MSFTDELKKGVILKSRPAEDTSRPKPGSTGPVNFAQEALSTKLRKVDRSVNQQPSSSNTGVPAFGLSKLKSRSDIAAPVEVKDTRPEWMIKQARLVEDRLAMEKRRLSIAGDDDDDDDDKDKEWEGGSRRKTRKHRSKRSVRSSTRKSSRSRYGGSKKRTSKQKVAGSHNAKHSSRSYSGGKRKHTQRHI
jgi:hypothetical protein